MSSPQNKSDRKISFGIDIAFIVIGLAVLLGLGFYAGKGVAEHLRWLTAKDKRTVTAQFVSVTDIKTGLREKDEDGNVYAVTHYDVTYRYELDGQTCTYVREDRTTYNYDDIELRFFRNGAGEYQRTDMYGMWAGVQWFLLLLAVWIGGRMIRFGVRSLKQDKAEKTAE